MFKQKILKILLALWLLPSSTCSLLGNTPEKARTVAKNMLERDDGEAFFNVTVLVSCDFELKKGKRKCSSSRRKKVFSSISVQLDKKGDEERTLSVISEPSNELGVGFLQEDKKNSEDGSLQWIYLPAIKKVKQIVSANQDGPKTGTLFGSEIAYEDIEKTYIEDYTYAYIEEAVEAKRQTDVIWMYPKGKRQKKSSYAASKVWVDKKTHIPVKNELYDKTNNLAKTYFNRKIEKVGKYWVAKQQIVVNHKKGRMSMLLQKESVPDPKIKKSMVNIRALSDANYRRQFFSH